ncbi:hypothetical protein SDC9_152764 [bioreactor metagenome]|uniref:Uncharacterized protein n=1 Tax=bioreactor metagenome TaxID=1076179 RepID=A0A645EYF2_9ZZZZ
MAGVGAANRDRRVLSHTTVLSDIDARQATKHIIHGGRLPAIDILTRNNGNRSEYCATRLLKTVGSDDESIRASVLCPTRKCRDGQRRAQQ